MLKITYSESDLLVEQVALTVEILVAQRSVVALRAGQPLVMQPGYGSFTLPADLPGVEVLTYTSHYRGMLEVVPCDAHCLEVTLRGTWFSNSLTSEEGILVTELGHTLERQLVTLWQLSMSRMVEQFRV
ncbi:MAG: hypothetical protein HC929_18855 [Leptolyngbyaceae cyanobacterium SM2_5_2]|nr:hypothetical protein [Leptolyngbyaceae cyanobacterium SM2_5_2]